jgi:hypothetical protein
MIKALWSLRVLVLGSLAVLLGIPSTTIAGNPVGGSLVISEAAEQEVSPTLAYNSLRQEYLAVWYNDRAGCDDIRAQRVSKNGALAGGPFYISAGCPADRNYPDVVYNSTHDQYLIVWEQYEAANGYSIQARRVSGTGQVLDTTDIVVRSPGYNTYTPVKPAVSYASTSDSYLVVWAETWHPTPITYEIIGQVMTETGALDGGQFTISQFSESLEEPDVAYNRHADRYLVVWQQWDGTASWDIYGQLVTGAGSIPPAFLPIQVAWYIEDCTSAAVAAIPTTPDSDKYLVVWEGEVDPGNRNIYGKVVEEDGTPGTLFPIATAVSVDESSPAIAGTESNLQYFVTWRHPQGLVDKPIKGQAVSYGGVLLGQVAEFSGVAADHPAVAAGPTGDFLVAWQDQPVAATNTNIYGQLWGNWIYMPLVLRNNP